MIGFATNGFAKFSEPVPRGDAFDGTVVELGFVNASCLEPMELPALEAPASFDWLRADWPVDSNTGLEKPSEAMILSSR